MRIKTNFLDLDSTEDDASDQLYLCDATGESWASGELCECGEIWGSHWGKDCPDATTKFRSTGVIVWWDGAYHGKSIATEEEIAFLMMATALTA